nr:unnamed protein product [Callosobruchus analis]
MIEEWNSEDELPLANVRLQEQAKKTLWTISSLKCLQNVNNFAKDFGPNVPYQIETPTDVFLQLFPESFIKLIVFQINLYGLQKHGNRSAFKTTNKVEIRDSKFIDEYQKTPKLSRLLVFKA